MAIFVLTCAFINLVERTVTVFVEVVDWLDHFDLNSSSDSLHYLFSFLLWEVSLYFEIIVFGQISQLLSSVSIWFGNINLGVFCPIVTLRIDTHPAEISFLSSSKTRFPLFHALNRLLLDLEFFR